jgi:hypothetical protein
MAQQLQAASIRPLQIVKDQEPRLLLRCMLDQLDQAGCKTHLLLSRFQRRRFGKIWQHTANLGNEAAKVAQQLLEFVGQRFGSMGGQVVLYHLSQEIVSWTLKFPAIPYEQDRGLALCGNPLRQTCLADT